MNRLILPLVDSLVDAYKGPSFSNVKIIGVQHILETTHAMFQALYPLGLRPENISILGKCYSSCKEVYDEMLADGIDVCPGSFAYTSHRSFDDHYTEIMHNFLSTRVKGFSEKPYDCIIVLDDGGKCISCLSEESLQGVPVIAIEQTSSGYEAIRNCNLPFSVINVARSPTKLTFETPLIAQAAAERLYISLEKLGLNVKEALIIGAGALGKVLQKRLSPGIKVAMYDINKSLSDFENDISDIIENFSLIIGCTGKTSIPHQFHSFLSPGTVLVSVSSSDREFDAHHLRKRIRETQRCHQDLAIDDLLLINSGFPVNFDGDRENIEPERIQLTIALITAGILQGRVSHGCNDGIIPLDSYFENKIANEFIN